MALVANAKGWTIEEAEAHYRTGEIFGQVAGQVAAARPEIYVGGVLSPDPAGAPSLYIKGPADDFVRTLVANAETEIIIVDNQPFSFDELEERKIQVHRALEAQGFRYVSTGSSIQVGGQITAAVTREPGLPDDPAEILSGLPPSLRGSVDLTVSDGPRGGRRRGLRRLAKRPEGHQLPGRRTGLLDKLATLAPSIEPRYRTDDRQPPPGEDVAGS